MKRKIINIIIDIALITCVFALVDVLAAKVFRIDSIWLDIGLYVALYIVVFGAKRGIVTIFKRKKGDFPTEKSENNEETK